jgi:ATP-dependent helicase HrpB
MPALDLPVEAELPAIEQAVIDGSLVLTAAPGAGKSSLVPLAVDAALLRAIPDAGKVMLLQPRRLAARATASRLADLRGEPLGRSVGYTMRGDRKPGERIEVVTEAILTNRLQRDPELTGVSAVIFDEFHERNLHSDLGLAMAIEARNTLRPDLRIVVMSATIDPGPIAELLTDATVIDVAGRVFPIETAHIHRPHRDAWAGAVAAATADVAGRVAGDVLVFAPGRFEIDDVIGRLPAETRRTARVVALHGSSPPGVHREVLQPSSDRRIIVASAIAETSITIPGVEAVVDGGLARRPRYDPLTATNHLVTEHVSRFSADQRRGRAGRTGPGVCVRMWSSSDQELLDDQAAPELVDGDPIVIAAELLRWGDPDGRHLALLDPPDPQRLAAARETMVWWGLTSADTGTKHHQLTELGRVVASLPVHPRVGALLATMQRTLESDDPLRSKVLLAAALLDQSTFPDTDDFERDVELARNDRDVQRSGDRLRRSIEAAEIPPIDGPHPGATSLADILALAWPDRIAVPRSNGSNRLLLASGREVRLDRTSTLSRGEAFVVVDTTVVEATGRVRRAVPIERGAITRLHLPTEHQVVEWDRSRGRVVANHERRHGAIVLHQERMAEPDRAAVQAAVAEGLRHVGLEAFRWSDRDQVLRQRLRWLHGEDASWPDMSDEALLDELDRWVDLSAVRSVNDLHRIAVGSKLLDLLDWEQRRSFDSLAPLELPTPSGRPRRLDWSRDRPVWAVRLQDLFGLDVHPVIGPASSPLTIELLSPAGRVAQTTTDLPGFWRGSYAAVRADLRGRYPKHSWPENPSSLSR